MSDTAAASREERSSLQSPVLYFLRLGTIGFGGPAALVGYMRKDLVDEKKSIDESTYNLALALAQIMPGPLAAQAAIAIGYFEGGIMGATLAGLAFILPSFLMVLALSWLYVTFGGLPWMQPARDSSGGWKPFCWARIPWPRATTCCYKYSSSSPRRGPLSLEAGWPSSRSCSRAPSTTSAGWTSTSSWTPSRSP